MTLRTLLLHSVLFSADTVVAHGSVAFIQFSSARTPSTSLMEVIPWVEGLISFASFFGSGFPTRTVIDIRELLTTEWAPPSLDSFGEEDDVSTLPANVVAAARNEVRSTRSDQADFANVQILIFVLLQALVSCNYGPCICLLLFSHSFNVSKAVLFFFFSNNRVTFDCLQPCLGFLPDSAGSL